MTKPTKAGRYNSLANLTEKIEHIPAKILFRRVRESSNSQALSELQNLALAHMRSGLSARWGKLTYETLGELASRCQRRIDILQAMETRRRAKQRDLIARKPYLAPALQEFNPHGTTEKQPENRKAQSASSRRSPKPQRRSSRRIE